MSTSTRNTYLVALAGAFSALMSCFTAASTSAAAFDAALGGTLCLAIGGQPGNQVQHLKLHLDPVKSPAPYNVISVHGVERGSCNGEDYENLFVGTATETPSLKSKNHGTALHMFLTGGGTNFKGDGSAVLWVQHYAMELDRETLTGTLTGHDTGSTGVVDGKPFGAEISNFVQRDLTPIDCSGF